MEILVDKNADQFSSALALHIMRQHPEYVGILDALIVKGAIQWSDIQSKLREKFQLDAALAQRSENALPSSTNKGGDKGNGKTPKGKGKNGGKR